MCTKEKEHKEKKEHDFHEELETLQREGIREGKGSYK